MLCRPSLVGVPPSFFSNSSRVRFITATSTIGRPSRTYFAGTSWSFVVPPAARERVLGPRTVSFRQLRHAALSAQAADVDSSNEHSQRTSTVIVGPLASDFDEAHLTTSFATCGAILRAHINWRYTEGELLGYGYVKFEDLQSVERALELDQSIVGGQTVHVRALVVEMNVLAIKGLTRAVDEAHLRSLFEKHGDVTYVRIRKTPPYKGQRENIAFIRFSSRPSARRAFQALDRTTIDGATISISRYTSGQKHTIYLAAKGEPPLTRIRVEGLPPQVHDDRLKKEFTQFGDIDFVRVLRPFSADSAFGTGNSTGQGYVHFTSTESVDKVLELNGRLTIDGQSIRIERAPAFVPAHEPNLRVRPGQYHPNRAWVSGLTRDVNNAQLSKEFERFGRVSRALVHRDRASNDSRRFGFVTFDSPEALEAALEQDGEMKIDGFTIKIRRAAMRHKPPNTSLYEPGRA